MDPRAYWQNVLLPGEEVKARWTFKKTSVAATDRRILLSGEFFEYDPATKKYTNVYKTIDVAYEHIISIEYKIFSRLRMWMLVLGLILLGLGIAMEYEFFYWAPQISEYSVAINFYITQIIALPLIIVGIILALKASKRIESVILHTAAGYIGFEVDTSKEKANLDNLFLYIRSKTSRKS